MVVDRAAGTVTFGAALSYGDLRGASRRRAGAAQSRLAAAHLGRGRRRDRDPWLGDHNGNLATAVAGLEIVTSSGEVVTAARGDAGFDGLSSGSAGSAWSPA